MSMHMPHCTTAKTAALTSRKGGRLEPPKEPGDCPEKIAKSRKPETIGIQLRRSQTPWEPGDIPHVRVAEIQFCASRQPRVGIVCTLREPAV